MKLQSTAYDGNFLGLFPDGGMRVGEEYQVDVPPFNPGEAMLFKKRPLWIL